jgi:hypothetical protein
MGKLSTGFFGVIAGAAGAAGYLAYRISKETGKSFTEALSEVPAEAERYWEEIRARGSEAVEAGREAARAKKSEIEEQLNKQGKPPA